MVFENDIKQCIEVMNKDGLILYPTDTIWGIGCDATNSVAVEKIYQLKNRSDEKSMIILVAGEKEILHYVADPDPEIFDFLKQTSRPTTVIYSKAKNLAKNLIGKDGSIAIRITSDEFCKELIRNLGKPVVSTSANISGEPFPKNFIEIKKEIKEQVDFVVNFRQNDDKEAAPSMLLKWEDGQVKILRS